MCVRAQYTFIHLTFELLPIFNYLYFLNTQIGFLTSVFARQLNPNCHSFILDGEIMGWHKEKQKFGSKGMNFDVKRVSEKSHYQPCFVVFDIILHNDVLLDDVPYQDRVELLNNVFTEKEGSLIICRSTLISNR